MTTTPKNDRRSVTLRAVQPTDADAMQAFVAGLGRTSRRWRFHGTVNGCAPGLLRHLTQVDGERHVAFVACVGGTIVGEARYFVAEARTAEFAIAVADDFQGKGIAGALLAALVDAACAAGLARLYGDVLDDNERMAAFMQRHGFSIDLSRWDAPAASVVRWERTLRVKRLRLPAWSKTALPRLFGRQPARAFALH